MRSFLFRSIVFFTIFIFIFDISASATEVIPLSAGKSILIGDKRITCNSSAQPPALLSDPFTIEYPTHHCSQLAQLFNSLRSPVSTAIRAWGRCVENGNQSKFVGQVTGMYSGQSLTFQVPMTLSFAASLVESLNTAQSNTIRFYALAKPTGISENDYVVHLTIDKF